VIDWAVLCVQDLAVEEAMLRLCAEDCGLTFENFVSLVQSDGTADLAALDAFDSRWHAREGSGSGSDRQRSVHHVKPTPA
jgi:hypothetical protein